MRFIECVGVVTVLFLVFTIPGLDAVQRAKYIGCYTNDVGILDIAVIQEKAERTLTRFQCTVFCFNQGFKYAATKNGTECHCGDLPENEDESPRLPFGRDETKCNVPCAGDNYSMCGGQYAVSLYSTGISERDIAKRGVKRWELGCFADNTNTRMLWHHKTDFIRTNTPKRCMAYCKALGYPNAGVEYKVECHCGTVRLTVPMADGCDSPCSGDPTLNCGGDWKIMVYTTQNFGTLKEVESAGCFKFDDGLSIISKSINLMTPDKCVAYCVYQGFPLAHIHNSNQCLCGRVFPPLKSKTSSEMCSIPCTGDKNKSCGGRDYVSLFRTGTQGDVILGKHISCFQDDHGTLLNGPKLDLGLENSVSFCVSRCLQVGYAFAGVRNARECQCSQTIPATPLKLMVPDFLCTSPCPKKELQNCGGSGYLSLYRTGLTPQQGNASIAEKEEEVDELVFHNRRPHPETAQQGKENEESVPEKGEDITDGVEELKFTTKKPQPTTTQQDDLIIGGSLPNSDENNVSSDREVVYEEKPSLNDKEAESKGFSGYVGCFLESRNETLLTAKRRSSETTMTIQQCNVFCFYNGHKFAATKRGNECYCGDLSEDFLPKPDNDDLCDTPCLSDPNNNCGGLTAFTIYSTGIQEQGINANMLRIGCLIDRGDSRLLKEFKVDLPDNNTPLRCIAICKSLGYPNAGVEYGSECHCGMTSRDKPLMRGCETPCTGDEDQNCGGNWRLDLYTTGSTHSAGGGIYPGYVGCFQENRNELILSARYKTTGDWMSIPQCNIYCFQFGFKYATIKNGKECICGDLRGGTLTNPDNNELCNVRCPSDTTTFCGGTNALTVHSTGINVINDVRGLRLGCMEDSTNSRLIKELKVEFYNTNTPELCVAYCTTLGYREAGTQYGLECFCGTAQRTTKPVEGCDIPCSGNPQQNCGGHWRLDVYSTRVSESVSDFLNIRQPQTDNDLFVAANKFFTGYTGCYLVGRSDVVIDAEVRVTERTMSILQCNTYCFSKGYKFAATKNGTQCSCGDLNENNIPKPDNDSLCDTPCLSDDQTKCGGKQAYTIYSTGIRENDLGEIARLKVGCLNDTDDTRLISEHKADFSKTNTPERCIAYCKALGYPHAGLQFGMECFCGLSQRLKPLIEGCDVPCAGNPNANCGGHWKLDVYTTGTFNVSIDITLNGCFGYDEDAGITRRTVSDMTQNKCIAYCFQQGLPYAHLFNGTQCMCGKVLPAMKHRVSIAKCNKPCPEDENTSCGGDLHMLTYSTGVNGNPSLGRLQSCYRDDDNDLIQGLKLNLGNENSIEFCIARCIEAGYTYAGLRNTRECQCTNRAPKRSLLKMVSSDYCDAPCPRIELQNCGAATYVALYRTGFVSEKEAGAGAVTPGYLGCFKANRNEIRLTGDQATVRGVSAKTCNTRCFKMGFKHAATRNGKECYCGDLDGPIPTPDDDKLCNVVCSSDIATRCGGRDAYSLYSTGINEDDIVLEDLEIGCLRDSDETRLLPEHKVDLTITNSPKRCIAYCRALGYLHAGTQYSIECHCGMARKTYPLDDGCDKVCVGDPDYLCGGDWKANVYSTGLTRSTTGISPRGCYNYNKTLISTRRNIPNMNHNLCVANCFSQGFSFAFIHNGVECLCGPKLPSSRLSTESRNCDVPCPGNEEKKCGGVTFMTALSTGVVGNPSLGKMIGCYKDDNNDIMTGRKYNLGQFNTIVLCLTRCIEEGYAYAGLRNTNECQCSQSAPSRTPVRIVPDYECSSPCPTNNLETCGAPLFTAIHRTGLAATAACGEASSKINGKNACAGQILFSEDFSTLDTSRWEHNVRISGEDGEFVIYTKKKKNIFVKGDKLIIKPTIIDQDNFIKRGHLNLAGCTGEAGSVECIADANSYQIIPPIESGQICTKKSFNFRYGVITVRAKLPKGDWVVPQIWLKPVREAYGKGYLSGKIMIVTSRGNNDLVGPEGNDIGAKIVESGLQVSTEPYWNIAQRTETLTGPEVWYNDFHNYTFTWTPDTLLFYVDGNVLTGLKTLYRVNEKPLLEEMGLKKDLKWRSGSIIAPFDEDFYLCIGVSVGGMRMFPDGSISNGIRKPWENKDRKNRLNFYLGKENWKSTWSEDTKLEVESVQITAF